MIFLLLSSYQYILTTISVCTSLLLSLQNLNGINLTILIAVLTVKLMLRTLQQRPNHQEHSGHSKHLAVMSWLRQHWRRNDSSDSNTENRPTQVFPPRTSFSSDAPSLSCNSFKCPSGYDPQLCCRYLYSQKAENTLKMTFPLRAVDISGANLHWTDS